MGCDCKFDFSHDNMIEFYEVCDEHKNHFGDFIGLMKKIVKEAKAWYK